MVGLKIASRLTGRAVANGYSREKPESPHVWHVYPEGSLAFLCDHLARSFDGAVRLESPVEAILVENGRAVGIRVRGQVHEASAVVSTAPVHILAKLVQGSDAVRHLADSATGRWSSSTCGSRAAACCPTWSPGPPIVDMPFFRLTEATWSMPWLAPDGQDHDQCGHRLRGRG